MERNVVQYERVSIPCPTECQLNSEGVREQVLTPRKTFYLSILDVGHNVEVRNVVICAVMNVCVCWPPGMFTVFRKLESKVRTNPVYDRSVEV